MERGGGGGREGHLGVRHEALDCRRYRVLPLNGPKRLQHQSVTNFLCDTATAPAPALRAAGRRDAV